MASKTVVITDVRISSRVADDQRSRRGDPDPYVVFSSSAGDVGSREQFQRNTFSPTFAGPYTLNLGGPRSAEEFSAKVWDYDLGSPSNDDLMEEVVVSLGMEGATGTKTFALSRGGSLTFTWSLRGRPEPAPAGDSPEKAAPAQSAAGPAAVAAPTLKISRLALQDLLPRDGRRGAVDPYVVITGISVDAQERWNTKRNERRPVWEESKSLPYDPMGYAVEVWDDDYGNGNGDDLLGNAEVKLPRGQDAQGAPLTLLWRGREYPAGSIDFGYAVEGGAPPNDMAGATVKAGDAEAPAAQERAEPATQQSEPSAPPVVTRKEIRKMRPEEQKRFVEAILECMKNKSGPQTSEYFRIAGYHGWPTDYCSHAQETFPGWHRGYLVELERALIQADKDLGNDGNIGVPYWDWTDLSMDEVMPKIIRENFPKLPDGFLDENDRGSGSLGRRGFDAVRDEWQLRRQLESARVSFQAEQCLSVSEHWMHASTRFNRQGYSVESPHNSVHVAVGFPMTSVKYAAFHPIFFLHHCNVDRLYEKHVQMESPDECAQEFRSRQVSLSRQGERDRFKQELKPFNHPFTGEPLMPRDTFDTRALGYVYDELPKTPAMQMREAPVFAAFLKLDPLKFSLKSYMMHVFVMPKDDAAGWKPSGGVQEWMQEASYAGCGAIFGSKGSECANCLDRPPYNVLVEVQEALRKQGLSRFNAGVRVMVDEEGETKTLEETEIDPPVLCGPAFEDTEASLSSGSSHGDVNQLQTLLGALGYAPGKTDGAFGPKTEAAVKRFQRFVGIKEDGIAGKITKEQLLKPRLDLHPDVVEATKAATPFVEGRKVFYTIGHLPGYLDKAKARAEIHDALEEWGNAINVPFVWTGSAVRAALRIDFEDLSAVGEALGGGLARPGGQLAEATSKGVKLDAAERWILQGQATTEKYPQAVYLYAVLLHEFGHVLGLSHSSNPEDVMWPYKKPEPAPRLSANDVARAQARVQLAGADGACATAPGDGNLRTDVAELRGEILAMRAEMREMSRVVAASFGNSAAGSGARAARNCCSP